MRLLAKKHNNYVELMRVSSEYLRRQDCVYANVDMSNKDKNLLVHQDINSVRPAIHFTNEKKFALLTVGRLYDEHFLAFSELVSPAAETLLLLCVALVFDLILVLFE